ncbi:alanine racemase [Ilumatobacter sp.]|uniref:alanine racemase n=1 Tax=Ilumatobacter sp. TaxID=1967498 RepID=UPI003B51D2DD
MPSAETDPTSTAAIPTPALVVERSVLDANLSAMDAVRPGRELRPHVKAFKSTALARRLADDGHPAFCAATVRELEGLVRAGVGDDLLLANETLDVERLARLVALADDAVAVTIAVDSDATLDAAIAAGVRSVLVDVEVGLPRCGCDPADAPRLAERARGAGIDVRGVMGYEGHLMMVRDRGRRTDAVGAAMAALVGAAEQVGGDVISGGGTGTFDVNEWCTEIQAGSYTLMDTQYLTLDLPFALALEVAATVVSVSAKGWIVVDAGLKSLGMDHGNPGWDGGEVMFCSDEHTTLSPRDASRHRVGDRVHLRPAHVDPTVARHEAMWLVDGDDVVDRWPIDLRHW